GSEVPGQSDQRRPEPDVARLCKAPRELGKDLGAELDEAVVRIGPPARTPLEQVVLDEGGRFSRHGLPLRVGTAVNLHPLTFDLVDESRDGAVEVARVDGGEEPAEQAGADTLAVEDERDLRFLGAGTSEPV